MLKRIRRLIIISRPIFWLPILAIYFAGVHYSHRSWDFVTWWTLLFLAFPMGLLVFGINDIADRASDAANNRKGHIEGAILKDDEIQSLILTIAILIGIFFAPLLITTHFVTLTALAMIVLFAVIYSLPPIRLKARPPLDSLSNGLWLLLIFLAGYSLGATNLEMWYPLPKIGWVILFTSIAIHILTTLFDDNVDRQIGDKTIGVVLGRRLAISLAILLFIGSLIVNPLGNCAASYFVLCIGLSTVMLVFPRSKLIHRATWILILLIPMYAFYYVTMR